MGVTVADVDPEQVIRLHLDSCLIQGLRPSTIDQRRGHLERLRAALLAQDPPCDLLTAMPAALERWTAGLGERSPSYRAQAVKHVRAFYAKEKPTDMVTACVEAAR
jgi:hypothetical protein